MANYATLKAAVQAVVKSNGVQSITGANLQSTLISMIESLGANYTFAGVATPSTSPGTPDQNVFYIGGAGTYTNFGTSYVVPVGNICVFAYNGAWGKTVLSVDGLANEINISKEFPTEGIDGSDRYTFQTAVAKVPVWMRNVGLRLIYTDANGISQTWVKWRSYGSFDYAGSWLNVALLENVYAVLDNTIGVDAGATAYDDSILTESGFINQYGVFVQNSSYVASDMIAMPAAPASMSGTLRFAMVQSATIPNGAVRTIAFYDTDQNFIGGKGLQSLVNGTNNVTGVATTIIPADAAYFRVCTTASDVMFKAAINVSVTGHVIDIYEQIAKEHEYIAEVDAQSPMFRGFDTAYTQHYDDSILTVADTYINASGVEVSHEGYCSSPLTAMPIKPLAVRGGIRLIRIKSRVNLNASMSAIAFYDADQNFIPMPVSPTMLNSYNYNDAVDALYFAPEGAAYYRVSERQVAPYIFTMAIDVAGNGIIGKVAEHEQALGALGGISKPSVWMPKNLYMLRGIKAQIFMSGIACAQNPESLHMAVTYGSGTTTSNARGYNRDRVFEWTPGVSDADQVYRFGYTHDFFGSASAANTTTMHNVAKKSSPLSNKNILCIGDSFTDYGIWTSELRHLLTGYTDDLTDPDNVNGNDGLTNLTFIGTRDTDKTPSEGYAGRTYQWFCGADSPFYYNGDVDFTAYCSDHGYSKIDIAIILLGTNGGNGEQYVKKIWDKLLEHNSSIKVLILGRCFAAPYGAGVTGMGNNQTWAVLSSGVQSLNATFETYTEEQTYSTNFLYVEYNALFDNANNMPWAEVAANERHADVKVRQATDNVHPSKYGFWQIADAIRGAFHYWCI